MNDMSFIIGRMRSAAAKKARAELIGPPHLVNDGARADFIMHGIAALHGVTIFEMRSRCRLPRVQDPRRIAIALIGSATALSSARIGRLFDRKHQCVTKAMLRQADIDGGLKPWARRQPTTKRAQDHLLHAFVAAGWSNGRIAARLRVREGAVADGLRRLYARLGVASRVQAALVFHGCDIADALATAERLAPPERESAA